MGGVFFDGKEIRMYSGGVGVLVKEELPVKVMEVSKRYGTTLSAAVFLKGNVVGEMFLKGKAVGVVHVCLRQEGSTPQRKRFFSRLWRE